MLITSKRRAVSGLSSTLSLAICSRPDCSLAISSRAGAIILHGPHHSAQKSTTTGVSALPTLSSKVASERVTMCSATAAVLSGVRSAGSLLTGATRSPGASFPSAWIRNRGSGVQGRVTHGLEVALGLDGRHAPAAGRGDGLAVDVVLHVAAREDPLERGSGRAALGEDVAVLVEVELAGEQ